MNSRTIHDISDLEKCRTRMWDMTIVLYLVLDITAVDILDIKQFKQFI